MSKVVLRDTITKSNVAEIIAILYFILSTQLEGWIVWVVFALGAINVIESIVWSIAFSGKDKISLPIKEEK